MTPATHKDPVVAALEAAMSATLKQMDEQLARAEKILARRRKARGGKTDALSG